MSVLLISTGFAALLYLVSGIAIMSAMKKGSEAKASSLLRWPVLLGLVLHGYAVGQEMFTAEAVHFGFGYAVSVMFFFAVVTLLIESWVHRIHALFGIILIAAAFGALFPVFFQGQVVPAADWTLAFRWHLVFALAAYSFMMIAFVQAVLMMLQNTRLRAKGLSANDDLFDSLPGLVVMERVFFRIVATGFFLPDAGADSGGGRHEGASGRLLPFRPQSGPHLDLLAGVRRFAPRPYGLGLACQDGSASFLGGICCLCGCLFCLQLRS